MAGSKSHTRKSGPRLLFVVPAMIVIIALITYFVVMPPPAQNSPVLNFSTNFSIAYSYYPYSVKSGACNTTAQPVISYVPPTRAVGIPGGIWNASAPYGSDGVNSRYPVFSPAPPQTNYPGFLPIYVQSKVNRTYTLRDYFNVYGEPLGANNTIGFTTPPSSSLINTLCVGSGWFWDICVGSNPNALHEGVWGSEPLSPGKYIALLYSELGCVSA